MAASLLGRTDPEELREAHATQYALFLQREIPDGVSAKNNPQVYELWRNAAEQSDAVFEASFDIQPIVDIYEFTEIPAEERPEWLQGVPLLLKLSTHEIIEGVDEIIDEINLFLEENGVEQTIGDDRMAGHKSGRESGESYIDDPTWGDPLVDDGGDDDEDDANFDCHIQVAPNSANIPILYGNNKVSEQDEASFAARRSAFLRRHLGNNSMSLERLQDSVRRGRSETSSGGKTLATKSATKTNHLLQNVRRTDRLGNKRLEKTQEQKQTPQTVQGSQRPQTESQPKSTKTKGKKIVHAPRYQPPAEDIEPRFNVPLSQHPLFQQAIDASMWAQFTEVEKLEVYRVIRRLRMEDSIQVPEPLASILEADTQQRKAAAERKRAMGNPTTRLADEPQSTFVTTKAYKMHPKNPLRESVAHQAEKHRRGVAPQSTQFGAFDDDDEVDMGDGDGDDGNDGNGDAMDMDDAMDQGDDPFANVTMSFTK